MRLGKKLTGWLEEAGWSDRELARRLKVSPSSVGRWKEGLSEPRRRELVALAKVTGMPLDYLADDDQDEPLVPDITTEEKVLLDVMRRLGVSSAEVLTAIVELVNRPATKRPVVIAHSYGGLIAAAVAGSRLHDGPVAMLPKGGDDQGDASGDQIPTPPDAPADEPRHVATLEEPEPGPRRPVVRKGRPKGGG